MLITKFNALIRNRFIWGFFAVLVSVTMVGFFTDIGGCIGGKHPAGTVGTLDGKPISFQVLKRAEQNVILRVRLTTGRDFNQSPELAALITHEAWKRLALLQLADQQKLWAGDEEVKVAIQRDPMFQDEGAFNRDRFNQFLQVLGQNLYVSPDQFWAYLREELTLDKIRRTVSSGMWSAPFEIDRLARNFADSFTVDYVTASRSALTRDVTVTEAQIRAFYDTHPETFTIPDRAQAAYVAFAFADYSNAPITPEALTNYYGEHINDFYYTNAAGTAGFRPASEVEPEIRRALSLGLGRDLAYDAASRFADSLYDHDGEAGFFRAAAAATGKTVRLTRYFTANEPLKELGVGADFNSAAFALTPEKGDNHSDPIIGSNAVYVLSYESLQPSRLPSFTEARDQAEAMALSEAKSKALAERGEKIARQVRAAVRAGTPFAAAAKAAGLSDAVKSGGPFTAYTAKEPFDNTRLVTAVISLQEGDISDLVPTEDGTLFLIRCTKRTPGDPGAMDPIRGQIRSSLNRRHAQLLVGEWEEDLLKSKGYVPPAPVTGDAEAGSEPDAPAQPAGPNTL